MVFALLLGLSADEVAQISSNGPMLADYDRQVQSSDSAEAHIAKEVRHKLLLPRCYSLVDDLEFIVQGRAATLFGSLTSEHSETKSQAESVVKKFKGVDNVVNNIKVLPPSLLDQQAQEKVHRAIANTASLSYTPGTPPQQSHNRRQSASHATGYALNENDKAMVGVAANGALQTSQVLRNSLGGLGTLLQDDN